MLGSPFIWGHNLVGQMYPLSNDVPATHPPPSDSTSIEPWEGSGLLGREPGLLLALGSKGKISRGGTGERLGLEFSKLECICIAMLAGCAFHRPRGQ